MLPDDVRFLQTLQKDDNGNIVYTFRGNIEKGIGGRYVWRRGYSATTHDNGVLYPWMQKLDCRRDARRMGRKAVFEESNVPFAS